MTQDTFPSDVTLPGEEKLVVFLRESFGLEGRLSPNPARALDFDFVGANGGRLTVRLHRECDPTPDPSGILQVLEALSETGPSPRTERPILSKSGAWSVCTSSPTGEPLRIHVLSSVEGDPGVPADPGSEEAFAIVHAIGLGIAKFHRHLAELRPESLPSRTTPSWSALREAAERELDPKTSTRGLRDSEALLARIAASANDLARQPIHGSLTVDDVLTQTTSGRRMATGVLGADTLREGFLFEDLASLLVSILEQQPDLYRVLTTFLQAYVSELPLSAPTADLLSSALRAFSFRRLVASGGRVERAHHVFQSLQQTPQKQLQALVRHAAGLPIVGFERATISWLTRFQAKAGPVLDPPPVSRSRTTFDLSVASLQFGGTSALHDDGILDALVSKALEDSKADLGVGRYLEPRSIYSTPQFLESSRLGISPRTIHLGIDLFAHAGTPVLSPFDGTVRSFGDNQAPRDYGPTIILEHRPEDGVRFFSLYGHLERRSLLGLSVGQRIERGTGFARIGSRDENGGYPPHVHFQILLDDFDQDGDFPGVARPEEILFWKRICPDPSGVLALPTSETTFQHADEATVLERRRQITGRNVTLSYERPLHLVRGSGAWMFDREGRPYLDTVNNVAHVGHCHPKVVARAAAQMAVLNTNSRFLHEAFLDYGEALRRRFPPHLSVVYFVNSGSEANDLAIRLARAHTKAWDLVVLDEAYHGHTETLIGASPYKHKGPGGRGTPCDVHVIPLPDPRLWSLDPEGSRRGHAAALSTAFEAARKRGSGAAAFLAESFVSCGGQILLPPAYVQEAHQIARNFGAVCIVDEVQCGFGRVGDEFWAFATQGVRPDIVTLGKPIANGHPMGAVVTTREIADAFDNGMDYFNTFGGNPVSCAAALAVLEIIAEEGLDEHARIVGRDWLEHLVELQQQFRLVHDVRGHGLFLGIELRTSSGQPATRQAKAIAERMRDLGFLTSRDGPGRNVLKLKPPLVITRAETELHTRALSAVLRSAIADPDLPP